MAGRPGHDPTRRNRNIGTSKQGRGKSNWVDIPTVQDRFFCERLNRPVVLSPEIHGETWRFLVEPTLADHVYALTPGDVRFVLELLPPNELEGLRVVVFRQPTRKQRTLGGVWGRWRFTDELGSGDRAYRTGARIFRTSTTLAVPVVFLEAVSSDATVRWPKRLRPDSVHELERLRRDGTRITEERRHYVLHQSMETCRATQLYRTLPREVGHHFDFWSRAGRHLGEVDEARWQRLWLGYWNRPSDEREACAHRHADTFRERMLARGTFPFDRVVDREELVRQGLDPAWFGVA